MHVLRINSFLWLIWRQFTRHSSINGRLASKWQQSALWLQCTRTCIHCIAACFQYRDVVKQFKNGYIFNNKRRHILTIKQIVYGYLFELFKSRLNRYNDVLTLERKSDAKVLILWLHTRDTCNQQKLSCCDLKHNPTNSYCFICHFNKQFKTCIAFFTTGLGQEKRVRIYICKQLRKFLTVRNFRIQLNNSFLQKTGVSENIECPNT